MSSVPEHPSRDDEAKADWFAPLWKRLTIVLLLVSWMLVEWQSGSRFFFALAGGVLVLAVYEFFIAKRDDP